MKKINNVWILVNVEYGKERIVVWAKDKKDLQPTLDKAQENNIPVFVRRASIVK